MPITESLSADKERENARDRALMARSASGEREALEELFKLYNEHVYHSCLRVCRNTDDAVEATQEAFLTVFKRMREHYADISSFRDYLFASSRNASLKIIARHRRAVPTEDVPDAANDRVLDVVEDPERSLLVEDQQHTVRRASERLSERQLEALKLYELDGMGYSEIGRKFGLEANAVAQLISRARQRLRAEVRYTGAAKRSSTDICTRAMALMSKKADGTLSKREATWLEPHLKGCDTCKTNLNMMEEVGASYRSLLPPSELIFEHVFRGSELAKLYPGPSNAITTSLKTAAHSIKLFVFGKKVTLSFLLLGGVLAVGMTSPKPDITSDAARVVSMREPGKARVISGTTKTRHIDIKVNDSNKGSPHTNSSPVTAGPSTGTGYGVPSSTPESGSGSTTTNSRAKVNRSRTRTGSGDVPAESTDPPESPAPPPESSAPPATPSPATSPSDPPPPATSPSDPPPPATSPSDPPPPADVEPPPPDPCFYGCRIVAP